MKLDKPLRDPDSKTSEHQVVRTKRIEKNIIRVISDALATQRINDAALYPGGFPLEIHRAELTASKTAVIYWSLPTPAREVTTPIDPGMRAPWLEPLDHSPTEYDDVERRRVGYHFPSSPVLDDLVSQIHTAAMKQVQRGISKKVRRHFRRRAEALKKLEENTRIVNPALSAAEEAAARSLAHNMATLRRIIANELRLKVGLIPRRCSPCALYSLMSSPLSLS